jgi:peroxiredoxin
MDPLRPGEGAVGWIDASTIYHVRMDSIRCGDIKVPMEDEGPASTVAYQVTAINGQINPTIAIAPGEMQRWRLVHGGWDQFRRLAVVDDGDNPTDDFRFAEIALDGLATGEAEPRSFKTSSVEIAPGQRSDVLIQAPALPAGSSRVYHLKQFEVDPSTTAHRAGQDPMYLARIVVRGDPPAGPMEFPDPTAVARCRPFAAIKDAELSSESRTFTFAAVDGRPDATPPATGFYTINHAAFHDQEPIPISLGGAEEWFLKANAGSHPFHIHVNPFEIVGYDGPNDRSQVGRWRDTLYIKEGETYRIRQRFLDFPGKTVFHCHFLDHEDQGMMVPVILSDGSRPLPPQEICKELRAPATKLTATATPAPTLRLPDVRGRLRGLEEFRHRNVILVFFQGITCFHCFEQLRDLVRAVREQAGLETEIVAVSSRKVTDPNRALEALGVTDADRFHLLIDEDHHAFRDFDCAEDVPRHGLFLIDRTGLIRASYVADTPFSDAGQVLERLRELVLSNRSAGVGLRPSP